MPSQNVFRGGLTQERLKEVLDYDPETGEFTWKMSNRGLQGKLAGRLHHSGYWLIKIDGILYAGHQLAWLYVNGQLLKNLDHEDRVRHHNWIKNLRPSTRAQNIVNSAVRADNRSGIKGVRCLKGRWQARISYQKRLVNLGYYDTKEEAGEVRELAGWLLYGEFSYS